MSIFKKGRKVDLSFPSVSSCLTLIKLNLGGAA